MSQEHEAQPTDREVDLETARDYFQGQAKVRDDALDAIVRWADEERMRGNFPMPAVLLNQARKAMKGEPWNS